MACGKPWLLVLLLLGTAELARGQGFSHNEHFVVLAPDQETAEDVLAKATHLRRIIALQWFGEELPEIRTQTLISVVLKGNRTRAGFWAMEGAEGKRFKLDLVNYRGAARDAALAHEISHLIMEVKFAGRFPVWADEGLASFQSEPSDLRDDAALMQAIAETGYWPRLEGVLETNRIDRSDRTSYAVATSFSSYLLHVGDTETFFRFAVAGVEIGWRDASHNCYGVPLDRLEHGWREWTRSHISNGHVLAIVTRPRKGAASGYLAEKPGR